MEQERYSPLARRFWLADQMKMPFAERREWEMATLSEKQAYADRALAAIKAAFVG